MIIEFKPLPRINPVVNAHGVAFGWLCIEWLPSRGCWSAESYLKYGGNQVMVGTPWGSLYVQVKP
jgi:hypothetical protein